MASKPEASEDEEQEGRNRRISAIKKKVKSGTYDIDPAKISRKIVDAHLSKKVPAKE